ncbi:MAG: preprotein translocase subunit YajC [Nocardioides sp.]
MGQLLSILPLVGIALVFWLLLIRPASRRQKELVAMRSTLNVGDEVVLTSGIHGAVRSIGDDTVGVEVADGVTLTVARAAIGAVHTAMPTEGFVEDEPKEN